LLLVLGAELLVRGAARLAAAMGVSSLVVGLTVVAFGTSAPELVVSSGAALRGQADLALGNVVGSNIFNVLFILALSAIVTPLIVQAQLVRFDVPVMIASSAAVLVLGLDGAITRLDGALLFTALLVYLTVLVLWSMRDPGANLQASQHVATGAGARLVDLGRIAAGLVLLVVGSRVLLDAAVTIARTLGVGELTIGLTLVAAGTSLPEVATSLMAAIRGERDIAVGNVVGSNIFNVLAVLGLAAAISPSGVRVADSALRFDIPVMIAVAVACLPIFFTEHKIARWEGLLLFGYYFVYIAYLVLSARSPEGVNWLEVAVLGFVLPLSLITLLVTGVRAYRSGNQPS
jgi:cation:H+ antiporter